MIHHACQSGRALTIVPVTAQTTSFHLLKPYDHDRIRHAALDHGPRQIQTRRARRAVVVHIVDGDAGQAELVEDALATGAVAVAIAGDALVDVVVVDLRVNEGFDAGFVAEFWRCQWVFDADSCGNVRDGKAYLCSRLFRGA